MARQLYVLTAAISLAVLAGPALAQGRGHGGGMGGGMAGGGMGVGAPSFAPGPSAEFGAGGRYGTDVRGGGPPEWAPAYGRRNKIRRARPPYGRAIGYHRKRATGWLPPGRPR